MIKIDGSMDANTTDGLINALSVAVHIGAAEELEGSDNRRFLTGEEVAAKIREHFPHFRYRIGHIRPLQVAYKTAIWNINKNRVR